MVASHAAKVLNESIPLSTLSYGGVITGAFEKRVIWQAICYYESQLPVRAHQWHPLSLKMATTIGIMPLAVTSFLSTT